MWCPGSDVVLDCIDSWSLPSSLLWMRPVNLICLPPAASVAVRSVLYSFAIIPPGERESWLPYLFMF